MSKNTAAKTVVDIRQFCKSTFTVTFAVELLGIDVWHDCSEGWLDLGPCTQGLKIQYQLYPGQIYDVDILIWPHVAKIWCGGQYGWVRTWQLLERRFLAFSISHAFPVRVTTLATFTATVTPSIGMASLSANAKNDKNVEVFLPALTFGQQRYFAPIVEGEESLANFIERLIWEPVAEYIPANFMDALFDVPQVVTDVRHRDEIIYRVKEAILNTNKIPEEKVEVEEPKEPVVREKRESKLIKEKVSKEKKKPEVVKVKFEIKLLGDSILAGAGRIVPFEVYGDRPPELGELITLISSVNLPAQDDLPIIFVNVESLYNVPMATFSKLSISQIYTSWTIGDEVHTSEPQNVKPAKEEVKFNDHHTLLLEPTTVSNVTARFLDMPFDIQLRGIRTIPTNTESPKFFGYQKGDHEFGIKPSRRDVVEETDFLIAVTKIDARPFSKGVNKFLRGEYPLYPPTVSFVNLEREAICTNDINHIKAPVKPTLVVPSHVVLEAQMNLEVSMGLVGCKSKKLTDSFSRLFCIMSDTECIMAILKIITEINEELLQENIKDGALSGFTLDTGNIVVLYVEGPTDGGILRVWEMTADFYPIIKPVFSSSARYATRIYPELLKAAMPFYVLKMYVPLGVLLACPPIYVRPALPLPTRSALLKLGRLVSGKLRAAPHRNEMPTANELKSFRLEFCVSPRPISLFQNEETQTKVNVCTLLPLYAASAPSAQSNCMTLQRINWENK